MSSIAKPQNASPLADVGAPLLITALLCLITAVVLWAFVPAMSKYSFLDVLAHSMSIGLIAAALTMWVTRKLQPERKSSVLWLTACLIPVATVAFLVGSFIARLIIGAPIGLTNFAIATDDIISFATTVIVTALCAGFFISRDQLSRLKLKAAEDGKRAETAKLAMLQAQVEPHMLFNTLANLRALISIDPDRALVMLDQLDGFLRLTLEGSRSLTNPLSKEFEGIEHYLAIMQVRLGDRLSYSLDCPDELAHHSVPSLLIQPVVENAIRHGIEPKVDGGEILVKARLTGDFLTIEVTDTGIGFTADSKPSTRRKGGGFGMESLRERLPDINGQASVQTISPLPGGGSGTTVLMKVKV
ncbi:MAG: sensor histidine kinase [Burkholderiaceae bacterium]